MKALCAPTSPDGVVSGEMGEEEVEELHGVPGEAGKDNPGGG